VKHFFVAFFIAFALVSKAQSSPTVFTRHMVWPGILGEYKFNDSWSAILDAQFRYEHTDSDIFQLYLRPSVTHKLNNGLLLSLGVGYFQLYPNPNGPLPARPEWRPWQEVGYRFKPNFHHTLYPRVRLEQRFIREYAGTELADEATFNSHRLRLRFDYTYAIGKETAGPWFLIAGNELFLYQKTDGFSAFDQNRTWAGVGHKINANHNLQLTYMYLYQQRNSSVADQFHIGRLIYQFTLARKPKEETK
jgi:hypothetical protein